MTQKIIALVGISGVGKTTFLRHLANEVELQHLTAGSLISKERSVEQESRDKLRLANIDENQKLLINGFHRTRNSKIPFVFMDGHAVIDNGERLEAISPDVFKALKVDAMIHLTASPERILQNRNGDSSRKRPKLSKQQLEQHQNTSTSATKTICNILDLPYMETQASEIGKIKQFLLEL